MAFIKCQYTNDYLLTFFLLPSQIKSISVPHIYTLDRTCLLAEYLHQLILGEYLRVTTIMKNMATIVQAFENDKQYEIELISTYIIPYFRLVVYGVLTTDNVNFLCQHFSF